MSEMGEWCLLQNVRDLVPRATTPGARRKSRSAVGTRSAVLPVLLAPGGRPRRRRCAWWGVCAGSIVRGRVPHTRPFVAANAHHRALLAALLPNNAHSPDAVAAALGSATLRPSRLLSLAAAATLSLLPGHVIGIQARVGAVSGDGATQRYPQSAALMRYVECAFAH